ncbi:hypothetical protein [Bacillus sp. JJ722]|uniref:hypothetical protein n=1 Tax=Bacillus sp. JJ722 TaxID=3122973 RepID=UPI002FFFD114
MDKITILKEFRQEWTSEELEEVIKYWDKGWSYSDIAHRLEMREQEVLMILIDLDSKSMLKQREGGINGSVNNDVYKYNAHNQLLYNELIHYNQNVRFTFEETVYICNWHDKISIKEIALSIGKTERSIVDRICYLKRTNQYEELRRVKWEEIAWQITAN